MKLYTQSNTIFQLIRTHRNIRYTCHSMYAALALQQSFLYFTSKKQQISSPRRKTNSSITPSVQIKTSAQGGPKDSHLTQIIAHDAAQKSDEHEPMHSRAPFEPRYHQKCQVSHRNRERLRWNSPPRYLLALSRTLC